MLVPAKGAFVACRRMVHRLFLNYYDPSLRISNLTPFKQTNEEFIATHLITDIFHERGLTPLIADMVVAL